MRINLINLPKDSPRAVLVNHLMDLAAQEFQVPMRMLYKQLLTGHDELGQAIAENLCEKGWQIAWYRLPNPYFDTQEEKPSSRCLSLSMGFIISENCDLLIQWKLQHA